MKSKYLTPVITALDKNGNLDIEGNKNIYDFLIQGGVSGLLIMGSAGEFYALSMAERKQLIDLAISYAQPRIKVLLGTGCMTIEDTIELSKYACDQGAENIILMSPYYFGLPECSVETFFASVADAVTCKVYLYNFPDRTGYDISPELTIKLIQEHPNIVGYKDTVSDMAHTRKLLRVVKAIAPDFEIFSGFDENFTRNVLSGGNGTIGALSNVYPELFADLIQTTEEGNLEAMSEIQIQIDQLMDLYAITDCFIPIIKEAMVLRGVQIQNYCKSPIAPANTKQIEEIRKIVETANVIHTH